MRERGWKEKKNGKNIPTNNGLSTLATSAERAAEAGGLRWQSPAWLSCSYPVSANGTIVH